MDAKFYNKMPFQIPLRKTWETGAEAIKLNPGETIIGPCDILSQFPFLQRVHEDFSRVESTIQPTSFNYEFKDRLLDTEKIVSSKPVQTIKKEEVTVEKVEEIPLNESEQNTTETVSESSGTIDFDPTTVNWVTVKVDQLEQACKVLNINISGLADKRPKDKKWELVKLVKAYYKI